MVGQTDGQKGLQYRVLHYMQSHGKNYSSETDVTCYEYVLR